MTSHTSWLQRWLESVWYDNSISSIGSRILLSPLAALYCGLNTLKRWKESSQNDFIDCPVIVVGNITVGGTGKTPLVVYLVKLLQQAGYKPAIITRGYGGKAEHWPQSVTADSDTSLVGDEAVLMASRTGVPVYVGPNRVDSIHQLQKKHDCDVIISDDGMQHYKLFRDIQIAVIDGKRLLGNGYCLPAGPLRERKHRLDNCDLIVVNGATDDSKISKNRNWLRMHVDGETIINIKTLEEKSLSYFKKQKVHAVTGIGNPQRFYQTLKKNDVELITHDYPDHYDFKEADFQFDDGISILMTEKDAVKCKSFSTENMWYLPVFAKLDERFDSMLLDRIRPLMS